MGITEPWAIYVLLAMIIVPIIAAWLMDAFYPMDEKTRKRNWRKPSVFNELDD